MNLLKDAMAVPEDMTIRDSDKSMSPGEISAATSVPATSDKSMVDSGSKKRSGSEQETALEKTTKRR